MNEGREALIELNNLTISYEGRPAVEDVSLSVYRGENLCLVGANGSGKSTLIMGILGLLKPDKGHVLVKNGLSSVAYLAQMNTAEKQFPATAWEIILSGTQVSSRRLPFYTRADKENARRAAARTKVEHLIKKRIGDMSGGEQQRVLIARALARNPEILILDEPCSALDPEITKELYALFDALKEEYGLALIISTHDWPYVRKSADRVLMINKKVEYLGPVNQWIGGQPVGEVHHG